jgi:hypothetical protein
MRMQHMMTYDIASARAAARAIAIMIPNHDLDVDVRVDERSCVR